MAEMSKRRVAIVVGTSKQATETCEFAEEDRASVLTATPVRMGGSSDLNGDYADSPGDGVKGEKWNKIFQRSPSQI
jgi:hypothetical protein